MRQATNAVSPPAATSGSPPHDATTKSPVVVPLVSMKAALTSELGLSWVKLRWKMASQRPPKAITRGERAKEPPITIVSGSRVVPVAPSTRMEKG